MSALYFSISSQQQIVTFFAMASTQEFVMYIIHALML